MSNIIGGAIWTNHALLRLGQRGFSKSMAIETLQHPDQKLTGKTSGSLEYQKRFGNSLVSIITKRNEQRELIVLSCWIEPPLPGTQDYKEKREYLAYKNLSSFGKILRVIKKQLFG